MRQFVINLYLKANMAIAVSTKKNRIISLNILLSAIL